MSENTLQMTMLFDFFGDLLTDKQKEYFDLYHNEDLSLSEIAAGAGISRQGVHDIITRAENTLTQLESKTGVVQKWSETREKLAHAEELAQNLKKLTAESPQIEKISNQLVKILSELAEK